MPATSLSVIGAVLLKYDALPFSPKPPAYFDQAPFRDAAGAAVALPYAVVTDDGTTFGENFGHVPVETTAFRIDLFAGSLAEADAAAHSVRFGDGGIADARGLDGAYSLPLNGLRLMSLVLVNVARQLDAARDGTARQVFRVTMRYSVQCQRDA